MPVPLPRTRPGRHPRRWLAAWLGAAALPVWAQAPAPPAGGAAPPGPEVTSPSGPPVRDLHDLRRAAPRVLQAGAAALGLTRQRLALVLGNGRSGGTVALPGAERDTQAVAAALRRAGFVVMVREDLPAAEMRAAVEEFARRLQPDGLGLVYATGLAAQHAGQAHLLARDLPLAAGSADAAGEPAWVARSLAVADVLRALAPPQGGTGAPPPRLLVLDAAYTHAALPAGAAPGIGALSLPPGVMALMAQPPGTVQPVPADATADRAAGPTPAAPGQAAGAVPQPGGAAPVPVAATPFARAVVAALGEPRLSAPQALRSAQRALLASQPAQPPAWLAGETDDREELAEPMLADALLPRSPEEALREGVREVARRASANGGFAAAGEQSVTDVLERAAPPPGQTATTATRPAATPPGAPAGETTPSRTSSSAPSLADAANALNTAGSVVATAAGVAATAATVAAGVKAAEAAAVAQLASRGVDLAAAAAGQAVALMARPSAPAQAGGGTAAAPSAAPALGAARAAAPATAPGPAGSSASTGTGTGTAPGAATGTGTALAQATAAGSLAEPPPQRPPAAPAQAAAPGGAGALPVSALVPPADQRQLQAPAPGAAGPAARETSGDPRTRRAGEQGERPAWQPRSNRFGHTEGDTYTFSATDTWKDEPLGVFTTAIEEVLSDGRLLANGQQVALDEQGRLTRQRGEDGSLSTFEPAQLLWWANPQRGQRQALAFKESFQRPGVGSGVAEWSGSSSVGRPRSIELPAGRFEVLPIESSGWITERLGNGQRSSRQFSRTVWYAPSLGHPVAIDIQDNDVRGQLLRRERVELLHVQSARSAAP